MNTPCLLNDVNLHHDIMFERTLTHLGKRLSETFCHKIQISPNSNMTIYDSDEGGVFFLMATSSNKHHKVYYVAFSTTFTTLEKTHNQWCSIYGNQKEEEEMNFQFHVDEETNHLQIVLENNTKDIIYYQMEKI